LHFILLLAVSLHALCHLVATDRTLVRGSPGWERAASAMATLWGQNLKETNPLRRGLVSYLNWAGIETSYGFFAPNIPLNYKLVFELHYPDGRVDYELPAVANPATGKRLSNLFEYIARTPNERLREVLIKMLAYAVWQEHSEASEVRAVFGFIRLPPVNEFRRGEKESYHSMFAYDFTFRKQSAGPQQ
jgi:hypothetical protein